MGKKPTSAKATSGVPAGKDIKDGTKKKIVVLLGDKRLFDPVAPGGVWDEDDFETIDLLKKALSELEGYEFQYLDNHLTLMDDLRSLKREGKVDLVFNLLDEGYYNDPRKELHVAALLEIIGIPYTGASPQSMAIRLDKGIVKGIARNLGVPVANGLLLDVGEPVPKVLPKGLDFPVFVKPNNTDAGQGITRKSVCKSIAEVEAKIAELRQDLCTAMPILVEEFLPGKDLTTGIVGNPGLKNFLQLPIAEEDYSMIPADLPRLCGWESKWDPNSPYWKTKSIRADLPPETKKAIEEGTKRMFTYTECRDYARFDWRLNSKGEPRLLDVNCNPGWCWDGHMAKLSAMLGISYPQMLGRILDAAFERIAAENACPSKLYKP